MKIEREDFFPFSLEYNFWMRDNIVYQYHFKDGLQKKYIYI